MELFILFLTAAGNYHLQRDREFMFKKPGVAPEHHWVCLQNQTTTEKKNTTHFCPKSRCAVNNVMKYF